jgi:hypothetical protein
MSGGALRLRLLMRLLLARLLLFRWSSLSRLIAASAGAIRLRLTSLKKRIGTGAVVLFLEHVLSKSGPVVLLLSGRWLALAQSLLSVLSRLLGSSLSFLEPPLHALVLLPLLFLLSLRGLVMFWHGIFVLSLCFLVTTSRR